MASLTVTSHQFGKAEFPGAEEKDTPLRLFPQTPFGPAAAFSGSVGQHITYLPCFFSINLTHFIEAKESVAVSLGHRLQSIRSIAPGSFVPVHQPSAPDRACHIEESRFPLGGIPPEIESVGLHAEGFQESCGKGRGKREKQSAVARAGRSHLLLPIL